MERNAALTPRGSAEALQRETTLKQKGDETPHSGCTDLSEWRLRSVVKYDTSWYEDCSLSQMHSVTAGNKDFFCSDAWRRMKA